MEPELRTNYSYALRRRLFKDVWNTELEKNDVNSSKPKLKKVARLYSNISTQEEKNKKRLQQKKLHKIRKLKTVCKKILNLRDNECVSYSKKHTTPTKRKVRSNFRRKRRRRQKNDTRERRREQKNDKVTQNTPVAELKQNQLSVQTTNTVINSSINTLKESGTNDTIKNKEREPISKIDSCKVHTEENSSSIQKCTKFNIEADPIKNYINNNKEVKQTPKLISIIKTSNNTIINDKMLHSSITSTNIIIQQSSISNKYTGRTNVIKDTIKNKEREPISKMDSCKVIAPLNTEENSSSIQKCTKSNIEADSIKNYINNNKEAKQTPKLISIIKSPNNTIINGKKLHSSITSTNISIHQSSISNKCTGRTNVPAHVIKDHSCEQKVISKVNPVQSPKNTTSRHPNLIRDDRNFKSEVKKALTLHYIEYPKNASNNQTNIIKGEYRMNEEIKKISTIKDTVSPNANNHANGSKPRIVNDIKKLSKLSFIEPLKYASDHHSDITKRDHIIKNDVKKISTLNSIDFAQNASSHHVNVIKHVRTQNDLKKISNLNSKESLTVSTCYANAGHSIKKDIKKIPNFIESFKNRNIHHENLNSYKSLPHTSGNKKQLSTSKMGELNMGGINRPTDIINCDSIDNTTNKLSDLDSSIELHKKSCIVKLI